MLQVEFGAKWNGTHLARDVPPLEHVLANPKSQMPGVQVRHVVSARSILHPRTRRKGLDVAYLAYVIARDVVVVVVVAVVAAAVVVAAAAIGGGVDECASAYVGIAVADG